ncbi:hypothetical protein [Microbacterium sp.]|uniref:hypothetical protein n=1 Tax=Microbacterium sp. TaxID=51671 RepID=UPI003A86B978
MFTPLLVDGGALADTLGRVIGVGESRGIGLMFGLVGVLLLVVAVLIPRVRSVRGLERNVARSGADRKEL